MSAVATEGAAHTIAWTTVALSDVAQVVNGGTPKSRVAKYWGGDVQWLTPKDMGHMGSREVAVTPRTITTEGLTNSSARVVPVNSVILSTRAPIGHLAINSVPMAFNQGCRGIVPSPDLDATFLYYFLYANKRQLNDLGSGATFKELSASNLKSVQLPLPPVEEQKRIVAVLDRAFAALDRARANVEANLADTRELFDSELRCTFENLAQENEPLPFDRLCGTLTPRAKIKRADYLVEGSYPIVSQEAETVSGYWNDADALLGVDEPVVVFGDHTCCLKYIDFDFVVGADGAKVLSPREGIDAGYLYFGLRSQPIGEGGYARHFKYLCTRSLPDLPLPEQRRIAEKMFRLEAGCARLAEIFRTKSTDLAFVRQTILQKAFGGELP